jgi:hypothetical protein
MALIEYERLREDLLKGDSRSKPFVSNDRKILFTPSKKSLNVDQRAIASHAILPTRELLKCNVLAYVVGFAWYPSREEDNKSRNRVEDAGTSPKVGSSKIDSQEREIPDIFRWPVQNKYERFRYFLRGDVELTEKKELYANILPKVLAEGENSDKGRKIFIFEGDSLGMKAYSHKEKVVVEKILCDRMKIKETYPVWLIGMHTSLDYTFSEILHEYLGEMMNKYVSKDMPMVLKRCDSILLSCMKAGERTALFETLENDYTLSFYCKPNFPDYDIYPFKVDIFVGKKVGSRSRDYDLVNDVDGVADEMMSLFSDPDLSWITSDDAAGRIIGTNRLLPIPLKEVYDKLRSEIYYDEKKTEPNALTEIYKEYIEET